jgi:hypothetical protein
VIATASFEKLATENFVIILQLPRASLSQSFLLRNQQIYNQLALSVVFKSKITAVDALKHPRVKDRESHPMVLSSNE